MVYNLFLLHILSERRLLRFCPERLEHDVEGPGEPEAVETSPEESTRERVEEITTSVTRMRQGSATADQRRAFRASLEGMISATRGKADRAAEYERYSSLLSEFFPAPERIRSMRDAVQGITTTVLSGEDLDPQQRASFPHLLQGLIQALRYSSEGGAPHPDLRTYEDLQAEFFPDSRRITEYRATIQSLERVIRAEGANPEQRARFQRVLRILIFTIGMQPPSVRRNPNEIELYTRLQAEFCPAPPQMRIWRQQIEEMAGRMRRGRDVGLPDREWLHSRLQQMIALAESMPVADRARYQADVRLYRSLLAEFFMTKERFDERCRTIESLLPTIRTGEATPEQYGTFETTLDALLLASRASADRSVHYERFLILRTEYHHRRMIGTLTDSIRDGRATAQERQQFLEAVSAILQARAAPTDATRYGTLLRDIARRYAASIERLAAMVRAGTASGPQKARLLADIRMRTAILRAWPEGEIDLAAVDANQRLLVEMEQLVLRQRIDWLRSAFEEKLRPVRDFRPIHPPDRERDVRLLRRLLFGGVDVNPADILRELHEKGAALVVPSEKIPITGTPYYVDVRPWRGDLSLEEIPFSRDGDPDNDIWSRLRALDFSAERKFLDQTGTIFLGERGARNRESIVGQSDDRCTVRAFGPGELENRIYIEVQTGDKTEQWCVDGIDIFRADAQIITMVRRSADGGPDPLTRLTFRNDIFDFTLHPSSTIVNAMGMRRGWGRRLRVHLEAHERARRREAADEAFIFAFDLPRGGRRIGYLPLHQASTHDPAMQGSTEQISDFYRIMHRAGYNLVAPPGTVRDGRPHEMRVIVNRSPTAIVREHIERFKNDGINHVYLDVFCHGKDRLEFAQPFGPPLTMRWLDLMDVFRRYPAMYFTVNTHACFGGWGEGAHDHFQHILHDPHGCAEGRMTLLTQTKPDIWNTTHNPYRSFLHYYLLIGHTFGRAHQLADMRTSALKGFNPEVHRSSRHYRGATYTAEGERAAREEHG